jgi:CheY-like chemotaxis protein
MPRILVVDDAPECRQVLRAALEQMHHEVHEASSGHDAVSLYSEVCPALVLLDMLMPDKDGLETLMELRALHNKARIVVMSDGGSINIEPVFAVASVLGATSVLKKPFGFDLLAETVTKALGTSAA